MDRRERPASRYRTARVTRIESLTPHMTRITFRGDDLRTVTIDAPDAYVKLFLPMPGRDVLELLPPFTGDIRSWYREYYALPDDERPPMRSYTVRAHRPDIAEMDIDFVVHGDTGPATRWVQLARPGEQVAFVGPRGTYAPPPTAGWQLLVGDDSALPAIGAIVERLDESAIARVFVEVPTPTDEQRLVGPAGVDIEWVHRNGSAPGNQLLSTIRSARLPAGTPFAWVAGEAGLVKHVRRHLVADRGIDKGAITFSGYWRSGVSEDAASKARLD